MVIQELLRNTVSALQRGGDSNAIFDGHLIVRTILNLSALDLVLKSKEAVSNAQVEAVEAAVLRCASGEPIQYVLGTQEFMSLPFIVTPDVLIPRADTETLVEHVLEFCMNRGVLVLDLCTGSGCIALSIAHYNKRAYVRGLDVSQKALDVAERNRDALELSERVAFEQADILNSTIFGRYDVIVSNPPYIETEVVKTLDRNVRDFEPHLALDGGVDGLDFYRRIVAISPAALNEGGMLAFEVGHTQAQAVAALLERDFCDIQIKEDLCGISRVVSGIKKS